MGHQSQVESHEHVPDDGLQKLARRGRGAIINSATGLTYSVRLAVAATAVISRLVQVLR
jgi:hypothetical protein